MPVLRLIDLYGYIRLFISTELIILRTDRAVFIVLVRPAFILTATYRLRCFIPRYRTVLGAFFGASLRAIFGADFCFIQCGRYGTDREF